MRHQIMLVTLRIQQTIGDLERKESFIENSGTYGLVKEKNMGIVPRVNGFGTHKWTSELRNQPVDIDLVPGSAKVKHLQKFGGFHGISVFGGWFNVDDKVSFKQKVEHFKWNVFFGLVGDVDVAIDVVTGFILVERRIDFFSRFSNLTDLFREMGGDFNSIGDGVVCVSEVLETTYVVDDGFLPVVRVFVC